MKSNKKNVHTEVFLALSLSLLIFSGCATSRAKFSSGSVSCLQLSYKKISSSAPERPPWALFEPKNANGIHYLVGVSNHHDTERDAREEAMSHARNEFAKYAGVEVKDLNEISHVFYGKSSGILDPTIIGKSESIQRADALVRRTRAKEWYFEKSVKSCRGENLGSAFQYWVLAEVPSEEYDMIQQWKANRIANLGTIILVSEKNLNIPNKDSIVGNILSEKLGNQGIRVVSNTSIGKKHLKDLKQALEDGEGIISDREALKPRVDSIVWGFVDTRLGSTGVEGLVSCFADASVEMISVKTGETIVHRNLSNIRGFGGNEERACLKALQNMGDQMGTAIIEKLGNQ